MKIELITPESVPSRRLRRWRLIQFPQLTMPLLAAYTPLGVEGHHELNRCRSDAAQMLEGQGANIAASVDEDGIVIADDQSAPPAEKSRPR